MLRIRHRISGLLTISVAAAVAATTLGISPAQAHTTTADLLPTGNGTHTTWTNDYDEIDESGTPNCTGGDSINTGTTGARESVLISLAGVPDGARITSVAVQSWHVGSGGTGGTYQTFIRIGGVDTDSGTNIGTTSASGCTAATAQSINVPGNPVKSASTVLEIGVLKTIADTDTVRIGALRATVTYNRAPSAPTLVSPADGFSTNDTTPTFDWTDSVDPDAGEPSSPTYELEVAAFNEIEAECHWGEGQFFSSGISEFTPGSALDFGTYCWQVAASDHFGQFSPLSAHRMITIEAPAVTAEITADNKVYDGTTAAEYTCDVVGEEAGDDVTCDGDDATFASAGVGTDIVVTATGLTLDGDDAGKYNLTNTSDTDTADISKATLAVEADAKSKNFGQADPTLTYTLTGFVNDEDALSAGITGAGQCDRDAGESVADSPYLISCTPGTLAATNYTFLAGDTDQLTIGQADPVCTINAFSGTYDGSSHGATGTCEGVDGEGELAGLNLGDSFTTVPGGTAEWTFTDQTGNYNDASGSVAVVILPATLSVDADDQSKSFGEDDPTLTATLTGFVNGENAASAGVTGAAACDRESGESVAGSPYTITCLPGTLEAGNYTLVAGATAQLTIGAGDVTAAITAADKPYDGTTDAEYTCEVVGADPDDEVSCDGEPGLFDDATTGSDKTVTANGLALSGEDAGNYNLTNSSDTDTADITKVPLAVDADDKAKAFGEDDPTLTYTLTGFVNDEDALSAGITGAGECTRDAGESVAGSPYDITCTAGTLAADNYTFQTGDTGQLTIGTATLSVDADDQSKAFGDPDPDLTYTLSGFPEGEDEESAGVTGAADCSRETGETVAGSPYTITCEPGTLAADNYTFETGETGELTIGSADVTAEITATDKEYDGTTEAAYTCDVVGEAADDDVTCSGTQPGVFESAGAGNGKTVTASDLVLGGEDAGSYTLTNDSDTDTADITKATLAVDADDKSKEVGEVDPELTYTLTGFKNGETALTAAGLGGAGDCTREAGETVADSPYTITCTPDTLEADNYDFETGATGELTINPDSSAPTVTINQGSTQDDPTTESPIVFDVEFSESVTGFEDGDVDLSGTAGATTANVTGSGTGYEVAVSGMTGGGTVIADVPAGAATDGTNDSEASTSDDNTVTFEELTFDPGPTATISGSPTVGSTLTAGEGSPSPAPDSYEYQWYADGNEIDGATNKTFKPTLAQVGKVITVKVTAVKDGYTDASDTSDPTAAVTGGSVPDPHGDLVVPVSDSTMTASCEFSVRGVVGTKVYTRFTAKANEKKASTFAKATVAKISMTCTAQPEGLPESAAFGPSFSNEGWAMYRTKYLQGPLAPSYQLCADLKYTLRNGTEHTVENCSS